MKTSKKKSFRNTPVKQVKNSHLQKLGYEITGEPLVDRAFQSMPRAIQEELNAIFEKVQNPYYRDKKELISRLEDLVLQYPQVPQISNYLAASYQMTRNKKAKQQVEANYNQHPDYLFSRIDYVRLCLERQDLAKVKDIFKEGFDLKLIYPQRSRFHVTEFVAFNFIICVYHRLSGDWESAKVVAQLLEDVAADHPVVAQVKRMTKDSFLNRLRYKYYFLKNGRKNKAATDIPNSLETQP
jgi:hypothetical protein